MQRNAAEAERLISEAREEFAHYISHPARPPMDESLDQELNARFISYVDSLQPMLELAKNGRLGAIIMYENETVRRRNNAYESVLLKANELQTERFREYLEKGHQRSFVSGERFFDSLVNVANDSSHVTPHDCHAASACCCTY